MWRNSRVLCERGEQRAARMARPSTLVGLEGGDCVPRIISVVTVSLVLFPAETEKVTRGGRQPPLGDFEILLSHERMRCQLVAPPPSTAQRKSTSHAASIGWQRVLGCDHIHSALGMAPLCSACSVSTHRSIRARLSGQVGDRSPTHSMWSSYVAVVELIHYACCVSGWSSTFHACRGDCVYPNKCGGAASSSRRGAAEMSITRGALPRFSTDLLLSHTHTHMGTGS